MTQSYDTQTCSGQCCLEPLALSLNAELCKSHTQQGCLLARLLSMRWNAARLLLPPAHPGTGRHWALLVYCHCLTHRVGHEAGERKYIKSCSALVHEGCAKNNHAGCHQRLISSSVDQQVLFKESTSGPAVALIEANHGICLNCSTCTVLLLSCRGGWKMALILQVSGLHPVRGDDTASMGLIHTGYEWETPALRRWWDGGTGWQLLQHCPSSWRANSIHQPNPPWGDWGWEDNWLGMAGHSAGTRVQGGAEEKRKTPQWHYTLDLDTCSQRRNSMSTLQQEDLETAMFWCLWHLSDAYIIFLSVF